MLSCAVVVLCVPSCGVSVSSLLSVSSSVCGPCVFSALVSIYVAVSDGLAQVSCKKKKNKKNEGLDGRLSVGFQDETCMAEPFDVSQHHVGHKAVFVGTLARYNVRKEDLEL